MRKAALRRPDLVSNRYDERFMLEVVAGVGLGQFTKSENKNKTDAPIYLGCWGFIPKTKVLRETASAL